MNTSIVSSDGYIPVKKGDMVIIIPEDDKPRRLAHLNSLNPKDQKEFDEITVLLNLVENKPTLKLVKG